MEICMFKKLYQLDIIQHASEYSMLCVLSF